jgi:hypothetical protein
MTRLSRAERLKRRQEYFEKVFEPYYKFIESLPEWQRGLATSLFMLASLIAIPTVVSLAAVGPILVLTAGYIGVSRYLSPEWAQLLVVLGILLLGTILYGVRCRYPGWYGALEMAVGFFFAAFAINQVLGKPMPNDGAIFATLAALYVIVRGYDNIYKALKVGEERTRRWNLLFFATDTTAKL